MALVYVAYSSIPTFVVDRNAVECEIRDILQSARQYNPALGISGGLIFTSRFFFQIIEGESGSVKELLEKIRHDPRHKDIQLIANAPLQERHFANWSMAHVHLDTLEYEMLDNLLEKPDDINPSIVNGLITLMARAAAQNSTISVKPVLAQ